MAKPKRNDAESDPLPGTPNYNFKPVDGVRVGESPFAGLTLRHTLRGHRDTIARVAWSPNGKLIASPSFDKTIHIWEADTGGLLRVLKGHTQRVIAVAWSPDGKTLASGGDEHRISIWDIDSGNLSGKLQSAHTWYVLSLAWSPNGSILASGSWDETIGIWDGTSRELLRTLPHSSHVTSVAWSPDGRALASAGYDGTISLWDVENWTISKYLQGHIRPVYSIAWTTDGNALLSASGDGTIRRWEIGTDAASVIEGHTGEVKSISCSADGAIFASKGAINDNSVRLWSADRDCTPLAQISEGSTHSWRPGLAFNPKSPILATLGSRETVIRVWDLDVAMLLSGQAAPESVRYTTAKLVLVGDSGVGKTGLGWRLARGEFKEHASTHGQQFWVIDELCAKRKDGTECEAVLWDLAGQHVYRSIHSIFLDNVDASLVLFDPSNRQEPLKGAQFWLEQLRGNGQLPPSILVGARVDRGALAVSQDYLAQFCQHYGISGGYISTSAKSGEGLEKLIKLLQEQIPWDEKATTVTTVTFKRVKDHVLALKERPNHKGVLVQPRQLRRQLQATDSNWHFTDAEMMTAVGHLETHGYVILLKSSSGELYILLAPDLLVDLASSIVLLADKHPRELGAVSETELLQGRYSFDELKGLDEAERHILLEAAVLRFLEHNVCFRETFGSDTLLIFPGLLKQKRPLEDGFPAADDMSYIVRGRVENLYAMLVVLLGYTPSFNRINQWQNQAQYEMGEGEVCGFRLIEDREGEIELVLYYSEQMSRRGRASFQELFERFLYQRDVEVTRFPPVMCRSGHWLDRATVIRLVREGKAFAFCPECGDKADLPDLDGPGIGTGASAWLQREEAAARLRSTYEGYLSKVKSYRRSRATPRCYLSGAPSEGRYAADLMHDLQDAGVYIIEEAAQVQPDDYIVVLDTPVYEHLWRNPTQAFAAEVKLVKDRIARKNLHLISVVLEGRPGSAGSHDLRSCTPGDFCDETHYPVSLFNLVLNLYAIPFNHVGFAPLRRSLHCQWEEAAGHLGQVIQAQNVNDSESMAESEDEILESLPALHEADVAILTILPEEYQAVCNKLAALQPAALRREHANLYAWKVGRVKAGESAYTVAVGMMGRAGTIESALATRDAIECWNPRYVFFVGIAGGLKSLNQGDVVIADVIHGFEYGKVENRTFTPRSNWTYKTDIGLLNGATAHIPWNWQKRITANPPQPTRVQAVAGEIASGDKVVDDPSHEFFAEVLKTWPKIIAVEMEGAGAGNAIEQTQALGKAVHYMMIRGISDLPRSPNADVEADRAGGIKERDAWKEYAADTAAAFTVSLIAGGLPLPPG